MTEGTTVSYPAHREAEVVLRDGSTALIRPVRGEDYPGVLAFLRHLSDESRHLRFFSAGAPLETAARQAVDVDYHDRYGLIALTGEPDQVIAHATYIRGGTDRAEIAFAVAESYQGLGIATIMLGQLTELAQASGIKLFEAFVMPSNHRMIEVFRESGFKVETYSGPGYIVVEFPAALTPEALESYDRREQVAAVSAVRALLAPKSVAVIGASHLRGTIGGEIFHNLLESHFVGPVYPVNNRVGVVQSILAYKSVLAVPGELDLAIIAVPAAAVVEEARHCAAKGVRSLVVISAGFAEAGAKGAERQRELLAVCRQAGMRLVGPNCMGVMNMAPGVSLNATFAPALPPPGRVGVLSQSGALGLAVIDYARQLGLGISSFVSVGNKADISGNDLVNFWDADPQTDLIVLYLESFGNPRKFARIARRVGKTKPILAVKSGRSAAGARATSSHTGAVIASSDATVDALFKQTGVIRADTLGELFDVASLMANQPVPGGRRVAILTNAGGPGILCADACEAAGLSLPTLAEDTRARLAEVLPAEASLANPVDMLATASAENFRRAIGLLAGAESFDAIIVIFIPPLVTQPDEVARAICAAARELPRPVPLLTVFMSARGVPPDLRRNDVRIPSYAFPEDAVRALARAVEYGEWCKKPEGVLPHFGDLRKDEATGVIAARLAAEPGWLSPEETARLASCYGLPLAEWRLAATADEAGRAAAELGGEVVLKAIAKGLLHKSDVSGVRVGLTSADQVVLAASEMAQAVSRSGFKVERFLVQRQVPEGVEMLIGVVHDPLFGPVLACGAGGTAVELIKDVAIRITPLTDRDASDMVRSLKTFPLLEGYRGRPPADLSALQDVLLRVSALVQNHPEVVEMDCNPVIVLPSGAAIVDVRVRVDVSTPEPPLSAHRP